MPALWEYELSSPPFHQAATVRLWGLRGGAWGPLELLGCVTVFLFGSWHSLSFRSRKAKGTRHLVGKSLLTWTSSFLPPGTTSSLLNFSFSGQAR